MRAEPTSSVAPLESDLDYAVVGQVGGGFSGLPVAGHIACLGHGPRLAVADVSDPAQPHEIAKSPPLSCSVTGVAVTANVAVLGRGLGLQIVDIEDPGRPTPRGWLARPPADTALPGGWPSHVIYANPDWRARVAFVSWLWRPGAVGTVRWSVTLAVR